MFRVKTYFKTDYGRDVDSGHATSKSLATQNSVFRGVYSRHGSL